MAINHLFSRRRVLGKEDNKKSLDIKQAYAISYEAQTHLRDNTTIKNLDFSKANIFVLKYKLS